MRLVPHPGWPNTKTNNENVTVKNKAISENGTKVMVGRGGGGTEHGCPRHSAKSGNMRSAAEIRRYLLSRRVSRSRSRITTQLSSQPQPSLPVVGKTSSTITAPCKCRLFVVGTVVAVCLILSQLDAILQLSVGREDAHESRDEQGSPFAQQKYRVSKRYGMESTRWKHKVRWHELPAICGQLTKSRTAVGTKR